MARYDHPKLEHEVSGGVNRHFLRVASEVSTTIGTDFLCILTQNLAHALEADSVYIGELVEGPVPLVRTLAVCVDGDIMRNFEIPLRGSPEAEVATGNPCIFLTDLQETFPADLRLAALGVEACVALPLADTEQGAVRGLIAAFYRHPLQEVQFARSILSMFASRVLAELKRKQVEDTLRETEQRYQAFVMLNPDPMWRIEFSEPVDTDLSEDQQVESILQQGYLAECNDALARLLRKEKEQLIGAGVDILSSSFYDAFRAATGSLVRSGYRFDTVETSPVDDAGKRRYFLRSHWGIVENGRLQRIWGMNREITELRQSQMALAVSERRLSELLETMHLAAIVLDREGALSFCNAYLLKLTGYRAEEIVGKNWFDAMIPPEERERQRVMLSSRTNGPNHFEGSLLCRDKHCLLVGWDYVVLPDGDGGIAGSMSTGRDITKRV
jgi:PAS domain S-box-containing protein